VICNVYVGIASDFHWFTQNGENIFKNPETLEHLAVQIVNGSSNAHIYTFRVRLLDLRETTQMSFPNSIISFRLTVL